MPESFLLPFLGGELGAKGAAVEEVVKHLPAVWHPLYDIPRSSSCTAQFAVLKGTQFAGTSHARCLQEVAAYTKNAISDSIMPVGLSDEKVQAFDVTKPFTYQIEFDLPPQLTWKRSYKGLKVKRALHSLQAAQTFTQYLAFASSTKLLWPNALVSWFCGPSRLCHM